MHFFIDAILILVFTLTVIHYYRIGFVKALFSICKFFIAVAVAFSFASSLGAIISEQFVIDPVHRSITDKVQNVADGLNENSYVSELVENLPGSIKILITSNDSLSDELNEELSDELVSDQTVAKVSNIISNRISYIISNIIAFAILFAVSMLLLSILAILLDKLCGLPIIKQVNKLLGLILGALLGIFHVFLASTVITLVLYIVGVDHPNFSIEIVRENTVVYPIIEDIDLSYLILEFFR